MKLNDTTAAKLKLPQGATDKIFFDDEMPGFGLRLREGGSRKFVMHYRVNGKQRRDTIGTTAALTVIEARAKARKLLVAVEDGRDPAAEKAEKRVAGGLIFKEVRTDYLAARSNDMRASTLSLATYQLTTLWKPLDALAIGAVTRATVAARLREIVAENGAVSADRARSALSAFYAWCIGEGLCEANPVTGTNKASDGVSRERVLTDAELVAVWNDAPASDYGDIVKLLILTAQRRDEIGSLAWPELTLEGDAPAIALPAERTKNNRPHDVPLSAPAVTILKGVAKTQGRSLVFGTGEGGYSGWSRSKERLDDSCKVTDWTLHDLRRTASTRMADLGVQPHIIEAVINHVSGHKAGVAGIYNRSAYVAEKRAALDLWGSHVLTLVAKASGANVTRLQPPQRLSFADKRS